MKLSLDELGKKASAPVIVFEPVTVRSGLAWRAWAIARTALLAWGVLSLAGVALGALVYAPGGTQTNLEAATPANKLIAAQPPLPIQPQPALANPAKVIQVREATAVATVPAKLAAPVKAEPADLPISRPVAATGPAVPSAKPVVEARIPQARPNEPLITGSLGRRLDAEPPRRFRRLRDVRLRFPHTPGTALRMPPPLRETDAVGRHIRHVWSSFPLRPHHGDAPWRDAGPAR